MGKDVFEKFPTPSNHHHAALESAGLPGRAWHVLANDHGLEIVSPRGDGGDAKNLEARPIIDKEKVAKSRDFSGEKCCEFILDNPAFLGTLEERNFGIPTVSTKRLAGKMLRAATAGYFNAEQFNVFNNRTIS